MFCKFSEEALMQTVSSLEANCAAISSSKFSFYTNGNCYAMSNTTMTYDAAKLSCNDVPGINGHLIHPRNVSQIAIVANYVLVRKKLP
jgi:hypothetical protein